MQVNVMQSLADRHGKPMQMQQEGFDLSALKPGELPPTRDFLLKDCILQALYNLHPDEKPELVGQMRRWKIVQKVEAVTKEAPFADLETEEWALVKQLIGKSYPVITIGRAIDLIEAVRSGVH